MTDATERGTGRQYRSGPDAYRPLSSSTSRTRSSLTTDKLKKLEDDLRERGVLK